MAEDSLQMTKSLYEQRKKNFVDTMSFIEPEKVPVGIEVAGWPFIYAGTTYRDVKNDPAKAAKAYTAFMDDVPIDNFILGVGVTLDPEIYHALGSNEYMLADDGVTIQHAQAMMQFMKDEEYDNLINDYDNFRTNILVRRNYPVFNLPKDQAYEAVRKAAVLFERLMDTNDCIMKGIAERELLITLDMQKIPMYFSALNQLFDFLRGMKDTLIDLRRRPKILREALKVITNNIRPKFNAEDYKGMNYPLGSTVYHSECFLSNEQFDEFYFRDFKEVYGPLMEAGVKYFLKGEGKFINTLDRLRELPKGSMLIMLDEDDPFEVYKKIGDWQTLATGITVDLLKYGTKQQCIDYAKKCFDTFAPGGGFVFCPNKPLLCANDTKIDNLIAVYEFADEYGKKR